MNYSTYYAIKGAALLVAAPFTGQDADLCALVGCLSAGAAVLIYWLEGVAA